MKAFKAALISLAVLSGTSLAADSFARGWHHGHGHHRHWGGHHHHHGGVRFGFAIGVPAFGYGYYSPYYAPYYAPYAYPPVVASPPVYAEQSDYVERSQAEAPAAEPRQGRQGRQGQGSWYFCRDSNAYYPYVKQCATEWERVAPRPQ
jgi:hypothetical protein